MSIKSLFDKIKITKSLVNKTAEDIGAEVESVNYHEADILDESRFIPAVDFSKAENFARYGSAKKYYEDAIQNIFKTYPYDGSLYEKINWGNSSSYIDLHILDKEYPRTNGYVNFSHGGWGAAGGSTRNGYGLPSTLEYISLYGGPNTKSTSPQTQGANIWDPTNNRESNLEFDLTEGVSVEFWLKKDAFITASTEKEVIFDLWNYANSDSATYGRFRIELTGAGPAQTGADPFRVTLLSGTVGIQSASVCASTFTTASVADGNWHHYAFTFKSASAGVTSRFYVDGDLNQQSTLGTVGINKVTGSMMAYIGALRTQISGGAADEGAGKLSGSLDEFRYWKEQRSSKDIGRYWFTQVGGGANSDLANTSLGVYYKFNEGITGVKATDATILDYSGRVSNGTWTGYAAGARSTGSAIVISAAATKEFRDPIVYSFHPDVTALYTSLGATGSVHDYANNASLFAMFPSWMQEKDSEEGGGLLDLTQIMASYFDSLYLQVESLNKIKAHEYVSGSDKPNVFANRLLEGRGLLAPELFLDADVLEKLADRSENMLYSSSLNDIKNTIYQNIYNNLIQIYKSKGTEKSFRNLIRCFGIDEEIIKLSLYGSNVEYDLRKNTTVTDVRKRLIDFNHTDRFGSVVFQNSSSTNSNSVSFITGSTDFLDEGYAFTLETEILFPKPFAEASANFATQNFTAFTSSLFGVHTAISADPAATTWNPLDATNFQVYAVRDEVRSSNAKFVLSASTGGCITGSILSSSLYNQVYNNSKWSLAVRIKPDTYAQANFTSGSNSDSHKWVVDFYGVEYAAGVLLNEFHTSGTLNRSDVPKGFVTGSKRIYVGAHVQDFTGSVIKSSDVKVAACRYWVDYLDNEAIRAHAKDVSNYGALRPSRNAYLYQSGINNFEVPQAATLAMNWDFETITGSNASGEFVVPDFSSGSTVLMTSRYGFLGNIINAQHTGRGYGFPASNAKVVDVDYIISDKQNLPENLYSEDMIKILTTQDDLEFTRESRPISFFFAFEKSMYRNISEEMLNMFGTITDFNNLIGEPVNKYRPQYKALSKLRQLFFERVGNTPDLDKFVEFYKWFDSALTSFLQQLVPAGADFAENIRVLIENHILARDKYQHKFPTLEMKMDDPIGTIQTVLPLGDDQPHGLKNGQPHGWKFAHHPVTNIQNENATWWKYYADRNKAPLRLPTAGENTARSMVSSSVGSARRHKRGVPYRFTVEKVANQRTIRSGINYSRKTRRDIVYQACSPVGPLVTGTNLPANIMLAPGNEVERFQDADPEGPVTKKRLGFGIDTAINRNLLYRKMDGNISAPFNLYRSSVKTGYNAQIANRFAQQTFLNEKSMEFGRTALDYVSYVTGSVNIGTVATWEALIGGSGTDAKAFSISSWVQNVSMPGGGFGGGGEGRVWDFSNGDRGLYFTTTNKLKFEIRDAGVTDVTSDTNSMDGNWHQVICTFEGGTAGALKIYIDGVLQDSDNVNAPVTITSDDCFIGNSSANTKTWGGFIDEVIIWNKSLSSSEIAEAYNGGRIVNARTITTYSNMIAWYRMGDSAGDSAATGETIYDAINGYNGTVAGDPRIRSHAMRGTLQDVELTNLHADVYGPDYETPMQGPFTEKFVGGRQHRHIEVNKGPPWQAALDTPADRAEGFKILVGTFLDYPGSPASGAIGIVGPQYPLTDSPAVRPPYLFNRPKATRMRDEGAKRPVNIKNILMTTGSLSQSVAGALMHSRLGNYQKNYQVIQTAGRSLNDPFFKDQSFDFALYPETTATRGRLPLDLPLRRTLEFDGNNDYIGIGTGATWDGDIGGAGASAAAFSISMWVYPTTQVDVFPYFISFGNNWRTLQTWGAAWPDQIRFAIRGTAGATYAYSATNAIVTDTWQHVIVTYSGAASGDMKIYIDGVLSGTPGTGPADILGITSGEACTIGSYYNGSQYNWPGNMCDVAVWGRELSQSEVDILYGSGTRINPKTSLSAGLISWWPMGADSRDAYDGIIHDEMRFQNGTPNNFPATALTNIQSPPFGGYGIFPTENIGGNLDYTLPNRTGTNSNETVIVNRFSAPGGYDVSSRGYMDPAHEEKSVYNALPFRNRNVIDYGRYIAITDDFLIGQGAEPGDPSISGTVHVIDQLSKSAPPPATPRAGRARGLNQRWALYCGQFGFDPAFGSASAATYVTVPSYHKINRNTRRRIEESDVPLLAGPGPWSWTANKLHTTGSVYDNAWVSHPIPRSDKQYLWITSSLSGNTAYPIGISNGYSTITEQSFIHGYDEASTYAFFPNDGSVYLTGSDYYNIGTAATWESLIGGTGKSAKAFTISMWVNSADVSDTQYLCNFGAYDRSLYFEADGSAKITFFIDGGTENGAVRTSALSDSTWYHVVATFDGGDPAGATGGGMKLYIDGVDDTNTVASNDLDNPQEIATTACSIGAVNAGAASWFNGFINQVSIWNAALTSTEVSELYAGRRAMNLPYHSRGSSLISWWMFNNADNGGDVGAAATVPANYFPNICDVIGGRTAEAGNTPVFSTTLGPAGWRYNSAPRHLLSHMIVSASSRSPASLGSTTFDCGDADFAGLRTLVVDDVDSSTNTLGSATLGGISYAAEFNGRQYAGASYINIGTAATWDALIGDDGADAKAFTVSLWFKAQARYADDGDVETTTLWNFGGSDRVLQISDTGDIDDGTEPFLIYIITGDTRHGIYYSDYNLIHYNRWHHVVCTYSGDTTGDMKIYIDGAEATYSLETTVSDPDQIQVYDCSLGGIVSSMDSTLDGNMADAAVWDTDLTAAQIKDLYNAGTTGRPIGGSGRFKNINDAFSTNLLAWWRMNPIINGAAIGRDSSGGTAYHGTPVNMNYIHDSRPNPEGFNVLMLNRNGAYGWPTFRQTEMGHSSPVTRYQRKNSQLTLRTKTVYDTSVQTAPPTAPVAVKGNAIVSYTEPVVESGHRTMVHTFITNNDVLDTKTNQMTTQRQALVYNHSFGNKVAYFANTSLNNKLNLKYNTDQSHIYFNRLNSILLKSEVNSMEDTPFASIDKIAANYRQQIYPASYNTYLNRTRRRTTFNIRDIWNDDPLNRRNEWGENPPVYPFGVSSSIGPIRQVEEGIGVDAVYCQSASVWPLDCHLSDGSEASATSSLVAGQFATVLSVEAKGGAGVLQNGFCGYGQFGSASISASVVYAQRGMFGADTKGRTVSPNGDSQPITNFGGDQLWQVGEQAGNNVPHLTYDRYCEQMRLAGKDFSIIPEFRMSEHIEFYVDQNGGNFWVDNDGEFDLTGSSIADSSVDNFYKVYSNSDFMKLFTVVDDAYDDEELVNGDIMKKDKITLQCNALIKFLPYKGFYPAERVMELSRLLSASYGSYMRAETCTRSGRYNATFVGASPSDFKQTRPAFRSFTEPLIGPGILCNTIKSGIAVENYLIRNSYDLWYRANSYMFGFEETNGGRLQLHGSPYISQNPTVQSVPMPERTQGRRHRGYYGRGLMDIQHSGAASQTSYFYMSKLPFEALLDPEAYMSRPALIPAMQGGGAGFEGGHIYDRGLFSGSISASYAGKSIIIGEGITTRSTLSNVLWDGGGRDLYKLAIDNFVCETVNFFQDDLKSYISVREDQFKPVVSGSTYTMKVRLHRPIHSFGITSGDDGAQTADSTLNLMNRPDTGSFQMFNRHSAFGRPISSSADIDQNRGVIPSWVHVTPPYYDGVAEATIVYTADMSAKPTLADIISNSKVYYSRTGEYVTTGSATNTINLNSYSRDERQKAMQLSASVNLFEQMTSIIPGTTRPTKRWLIQSKFETPVLNFANVSGAIPAMANSPTASQQGAPVKMTVDNEPTIGMWLQKGSLPKEEAGIYLSLNPPLGGIKVGSAGTFYKAPKSLIDIVGFVPGKGAKIGTIKTEKVVEEAVVAIPFTLGKDGRRKFYKIRKKDVDHQIRRNRGETIDEGVPTDIQIIVNAVDKYIFPPKFDFIRNGNIDPFAMFIFEFKKVLTQENLANIWQNIPPNIGYQQQSGEVEDGTFERQTAAMQHSLLSDVIFDNNNRKITKDLRWMVFKVKIRGASDYNRFRRRNLPQDIETIPPSIDSPYSYNWPYDYFSLVELVNIEAGMQYGSTPSTTRVPTAEAAAGCLDQVQIDQIIGMGGSVPAGRGCPGTTHAPGGAGAIPEPEE